MTIGKIPRNRLCSQLLESSFRRVARKLGKNVSGLENRTQRVPKRSYQSLVGWNPFQPLFMFGQQFFENEKDKGRVRDYQFQSIVSAIEAGPFCRLKLFLFFVNFWLSFFLINGQLSWQFFLFTIRPSLVYYVSEYTYCERKISGTNSRRS